MNERARIPTGGARVAGVIGSPIRQSLSPLLHTSWLNVRGIDGVFAPFEVTEENFDHAIHALDLLKVVGVNVTAPLKQLAFAHCDTVSERAQFTGAVNLMIHEHAGGWSGDNTDILGVQAVIAEAQIATRRKAVVLGAGGAARATIFALAESNWTEITLINRSLEKANTLAALATAQHPKVIWRVVGWESRHESLSGADIVINSTSLGMTGKPPLDLDIIALDRNAFVFDAVYAPLETNFVRDAKQRGLRAVGGLTMLIEQARPSFEAFFGQSPPSQAEFDAHSLLRHTLESLR